MINFFGFDLSQVRVLDILNMPKKFCKELQIEQCIARRVFCICSHILNHQFFENIPREEIHKISSTADVIRLQAGENLFFKDSKIEKIFFVLKGQVKIYANDTDSNREFISEFIEDGGSIGLEFLLLQDYSWQYHGKALIDSIILTIDKSILTKITNRNIELLNNLIKYLSLNVVQQSQKSQDLVLIEVSDRLLNYLRLQAENSQLKKFTLSLTKTELAYYLGTIPETLSRSFTKLKQAKKININRNQIELLTKA